MTWLIRFIYGFDVKTESTSGGNHVPTSYHWQHRAIDVSGAPSEMMRLHQKALARAGELREAFYDPAGRYVKNGQVRLGAIGGHSDHVHLAR